MDRVVARLVVVVGLTLASVSPVTAQAPKKKTVCTANCEIQVTDKRSRAGHGEKPEDSLKTSGKKLTWTFRHPSGRAVMVQITGFTPGCPGTLTVDGVTRRCDATLVWEDSTTSRTMQVAFQGDASVSGRYEFHMILRTDPSDTDIVDVDPEIEIDGANPILIIVLGLAALVLVGGGIYVFGFRPQTR